MTKAKEHSIAYFIKGSPCDNFNIAKYGKDHCLYRVSAFNQQIKETQPHCLVTLEKNSVYMKSAGVLSLTSMEAGFFKCTFH